MYFQYLRVEWFNYLDWHEPVLITLGCLDSDLSLRIDEPSQPSDTSTQTEQALYENWERSNHLSLMIIKNKIAKNIHKSILDSTKACEYLNFVGQQFKAIDMALAGTLMTTLTTK